MAATSAARSVMARWSVAGKGAVHLIQNGHDNAYRDGEQFEVRLSP